METQYGGLGQWDCMIMVTRMQHNAVTKLPLTVAVDVQCKTVTVNFRDVLCLSLFWSQYGVSYYSKKDNKEVLEGLWIPKDDASEESADYLFLSCMVARMIVAHGMWPVLAWIVSGNNSTIDLGRTKGEVVCILNGNTYRW